MESEIWKVYKESFHPTRGKKVYEVSDQGNVKINGKLVDFSKYTKKDYYIIGGFYVHRAVAELFIPNPENKQYIDHINTNKHDNRKENLRWVTNKENCNNPLTIKHISEVMNSTEIKIKHRAGAKEAQNRLEVKVKKSDALKGKNKNKCHMTNGIDRVFIKPELVYYYIERGYHLGRK